MGAGRCRRRAVPGLVPHGGPLVGGRSWRPRQDRHGPGYGDHRSLRCRRRTPATGPTAGPSRRRSHTQPSRQCQGRGRAGNRRRSRAGGPSRAGDSGRCGRRTRLCLRLGRGCRSGGGVMEGPDHETDQPVNVGQRQPAGRRAQPPRPVGQDDALGARVPGRPHVALIAPLVLKDQERWLLFHHHPVCPKPGEALRRSKRKTGPA